MEIQESIMISGGGVRESYKDPFPIQDSVMISLTGAGATSTKPLTGNKKGSNFGANTNRSHIYTTNDNNYSIKYEQENPHNNNTQIKR